MKARLTGILLTMLAMLLAALSTGTQVYWMALIMLAAILLMSLLSVLWTLWTARVRVRDGRVRVQRGESPEILFHVRHYSLLPVASVQVLLEVKPAGTTRQEINVRTPPFTERGYRSTIPCPHRGVYEAGISSVTVRDVFGLFTITKGIRSKRVKVEVVPRAAQQAAMTLKPSDMGREFVSRSVEDTASPSGIRGWQDGDSLKKVHWKLSARRRELMVRTYEESARPDLLLLPDLSRIDAMQDQRLSLEDQVCEYALGAAKAQLEAGDRVVMPLVCAAPSEITGQFPADTAAFCDALTRATFDSPYPYEQVLMLIRARMQRLGGAILVTPRLTLRVADMVLRMHRAGMQMSVIWITDSPEAEMVEAMTRLKAEGIATTRIDPWQRASERKRNERE